MRAVTKMITVRLPETVFRAAHVAAIRSGDSLNRWCVTRLVDAIEAQGVEPAELPQPVDLPAVQECVGLSCYCSICRKPTPPILFMRGKWRCFKCDRKLFRRRAIGAAAASPS